MLSLITQTAIRLAEDGSSVINHDINPDDVTPGVIGFVVTLVFALAIILLGLDLYRRVRRMQYREEVKAEIAAELAEGATSTTDESVVNDADSASVQPTEETPESPDAHPRA